jgi:endonuclease/exonuclease/phosphatase family metal-dependent hydrolase
VFPRFIVGLFATVTSFLSSASQAAPQTIRVVTYNIQADVGIDNTTLLGNVATAIEGIGQQKYAGDGVLQRPDIIALQETTSNSTTVAPLVSNLNSNYGSSAYAYSAYQATQNGSPTVGNGPNALIYNPNTLNLLSSTGVGTPQGSSNGEYRQVVRYAFQPLALTGTSNGIFYVYNSHYKSGSASSTSGGTTIGALRNQEAQLIRNDEAANLPTTASVIYTGDFNLDGSTEAMYQTLTAVNSPGGVGQGRGADPLNPSNDYTQDWSLAAAAPIMTDSVNNLRYRDDLQLMTLNIYNGSPGALSYVAGSYHAFGNNGTTAHNGNINSVANTSLNDITGNGPLTPSQVLAAMNNTTGADHLPVVADYTIAIPEPGSVVLLAIGGAFLLRRGRRRIVATGALSIPMS